MRKIVVVILSLIIFSHALFAQNSSINVLSPVEGIWCNKQKLVINQENNNDYYYSLNGEDPLISGFAYDGPVLLNITGDVKLRIRDSKGNEKRINYTVIQDSINSLSYNDFIKSFSDTGDIDYVCGTYIDIPSTLSYCIDLPDNNKLSGRSINLSDKHTFSQIIPIILFDESENKQWRFVINVFPQKNGENVHSNVPFTLYNWENISFNNKDLIYKVDDEYWQGYEKPVVIDRSVSHTISWQSIDYKQGNLIESFELPPKINLNKTIENDGVLKIDINNNKDEKYKISLKSQLSNSPVLFNKIYIDSFVGQKQMNDFDFDVYYDSVYQGTFTELCLIDKTVPSKPEFIFSGEGFRLKELDVKTLCENNCNIYISISEPYYLSEDDYDYDMEFYNTLDIRMNSFVNTCSNEFDSSFKPNSKNSCFYKIKAYCSNGKYNSEISECCFIIDNNEYYVDESAVTEKMDGSKKHPFNNIKTCLEHTKNLNKPIIKLSGKIHINENLNISNDYCFTGYSDNEIILSKNASINIENSNVVFSNCSFLIEENDYIYNDFVKNYFNVKKSELYFNNTVVSVNFDRSGNFIYANDSKLFFSEDCLCSVFSESNTSFVIGENCNIKITDSVITATGITTTLFSVSNSEIFIKDNFMNVSGKSGRIVELFDSELYLEKNEIKSNLEKINGFSAVYKNHNSKLVEKNNEYYGF